MPGKRITIPLHKLRVSQREIRVSRSKQIAEAWKKHPHKFTSPLLVSREIDNSHTIVDGHHRLMAALLLHEEGHFKKDHPIRVYCIDHPASSLLEKANAFGYNKVPQYF
jgi:ParB-like chromosome segregation protein Spo0J